VRYVSISNPLACAERPREPCLTWASSCCSMPSSGKFPCTEWRFGQRCTLQDRPVLLRTCAGHGLKPLSDSKPFDCVSSSAALAGISSPGTVSSSDWTSRFVRDPGSAWWNLNARYCGNGFTTTRFRVPRNTVHYGWIFVSESRSAGRSPAEGPLRPRPRSSCGDEEYSPSNAQQALATFV